MKKTLKTIIALLTLVAFTSTQAAVTGRSSDASLAGTEKLLSDSSGTDTFILLSTLWGTAQPLTAGITATGSSSWDWSAATGTFKTSTGINTFGGSAHNFSAVLQPTTNDAAALGTSTLGFSDLFLASGAVIDINNTNWRATHTSGILTVGTGDLRVTTAGTNTASVVTVGGTQTLTGKTATALVVADGLTASGSASNDFSASTGTFKTSTGVNTFGGSTHTFAGDAKPATDGTGNLGTAALSWDNLFLDTLATINFDNSNVVLTHSSGILTMGTGELRITTAGTNAASVITQGSTNSLTNKTIVSGVFATGLTASGSAANTFAGSTGTFITSTGANTFKGSAHNFDAVLQPTTNDVAALGTTTLGFSDLFLASGGTVHFADTDWVATHSAGILTIGTGELRITTAGTNAASVITQGSTNSLTNKTIVSGVFATGLTASGSAANTFAGSTGTFITSTGANTFKGSAHNFDAVLQPTTNDVAALGTSSLGFSDLFLATGGTVHFGNTDWVATHSTGVLTVGTGNIIISTGGTAAGSVVTNNATQTISGKTLTSPTITGFTATGTSTIAAGLTATSPSLVTPTIKDLTEVVTATNVITAAETGSVFFLNSATEFVSTLPAVAAGLHFTFIVTAAPSGANYTIVAASGTPIKGHVLTTDVNSATDPDFATTGVLTINIVDGKAVAGDMIELWCDGTNWFATAKCSLFDAITFD